jgi:hypothetical protein
MMLNIPYAQTESIQIRLFLIFNYADESIDILSHIT